MLSVIVKQGLRAVDFLIQCCLVSLCVGKIIQYVREVLAFYNQETLSL